MTKQQEEKERKNREKAEKEEKKISWKKNMKKSRRIQR